METKHAASVFEVLSFGARLDIFRLLVKYAPEGLVAGDIARKTGIPLSNLSFHLKVLLRGGLVGMEREGRFWRYRANIPLMLETIAYLTAECCTGNPEQCLSYRAASRVLPEFLPPCGGKPKN